ncbi:MAG: class I SAM-dependent methyltransferase [Caulobacteraceae bacterium]
MTSAARAAADRLDLWTKILSQLEPRRVLEIGIWRGSFAARLLARCPSIQTYYMVDPWRPLADWNKPKNVDAQKFEQVFQDAMAITEAAEKKRVVLRGTTCEVVDRIEDGSLDFAYLDGDHTLRGITVDLVSTYPKVAPGGWLGGDDFSSSIWQHDPKFEPTLVFPLAVHFAEGAGAPIYALPFGQYILQKPAQGVRDFRFVDLVGGYADRDLLSQLPPPANQALE